MQIVETVWSPIICYVGGGVMLQGASLRRWGHSGTILTWKSQARLLRKGLAGRPSTGRPPLWEPSWFLFDTMTQWLFCAYLQKGRVSEKRRFQRRDLR